MQTAQGNHVTAEKAISLDQHAAVDNENFCRVTQVWDRASKREYQFLTNHRELLAVTFAANYSGRWRVELFFMAWKQCLRIESFMASSPMH